MKILRQFGIIFGIYWLSQCIEAILPFSFPASVIGLLVLLLLLLPGILKADSIREVAEFLTGNLTFFLLPGIILSYRFRFWIYILSDDPSLSTIDIQKRKR